MKNKTAWIIGGAILIAAIGISTLIANNYYISNQRKEQNIPTESLVREFLKDDDLTSSYSMRHDYIWGCTEEIGGQEDYCQCTYDYMLKRVGEDNLFEFFVSLYTDDASDESIGIFTDTIDNCMGEINW